MAQFCWGEWRVLEKLLLVLTILPASCMFSNPMCELWELCLLSWGTVQSRAVPEPVLLKQSWKPELRRGFSGKLQVRLAAWLGQFSGVWRYFLVKVWRKSLLLQRLHLLEIRTKTAYTYFTMKTGKKFILVLVISLSPLKNLTSGVVF